MSSTVASRWDAIQAEIRRASEEAGRDPSSITTIVVTKFHPVSLVRELYAAGARHVGENRHQEAVAKHAELKDLDLTWHFVGQLQSNKARAVSEYASVIHSVDRPSLVDALERAEKPLDVFLEVNMTSVPGRGGVEPSGLLDLAEHVLRVPTLSLRGIMAVAPQYEDAAKAFDRVRRYSLDLQTIAPFASDLSIGMSGDFREAIAAGATHLRIGSAITGNRPEKT